MSNLAFNVFGYQIVYIFTTDVTLVVALMIRLNSLLPLSYGSVYLFALFTDSSNRLTMIERSVVLTSTDGTLRNFRHNDT